MNYKIELSSEEVPKKWYNINADLPCELLALITYLAEEDKAEKILENQKVIKTPIVRNGKQATVGYQPDVWKKWD